MSDRRSIDQEPALVEVLSFPECPNRETLIERLLALIAASGVPAIVVERIVDTEVAAESERFLGSPTVRVDGIDVEAGAYSRTNFGLVCRLYHSGTGPQPIPPDSWITQALLQHDSAGRSTTGRTRTARVLSWGLKHHVPKRRGYGGQIASDKAAER